MDTFKKPEMLMTTFLAIVLIAYIAYDYRKVNSHAEKIKVIEEHLSATIRTVDTITQQTSRIQPLIQQLVQLKERQDELEEMEEKCQELVESLEDLIDNLRENGTLTLDVDLPEFGEVYSKKKSKKAKAKKSKKDKRTKSKKEDDKKKSKKSKKEESSSEEESSSSEEDNSKALARISRARDNKKKSK